MPYDQPEGQGEGPIVVSTDNLTVEKHLTRPEEDVVTAKFDITSNHDKSVGLSIIEKIPEGIDRTHIGFHSEYDPEGWSVFEGILRYDTEIPPAGTVETVYGIRREHLDETPSILHVPMVHVGRSADGDMMNESTFGKGEGLHFGLSADDGSFDERRSILDAFVAACEDEVLSNHEQSVVRRGLGVEPLYSLDSRLQQVQTRVDDIEAYRRTLEQFIEEHGGFEEVLDDLSDSIRDLENSQRHLEARIQALEGRGDLQDAPSRDAFIAAGFKSICTFEESE